MSNPLNVPGYDQRSTWGYDAHAGAWTATLHPNATDAQPILINGFNPPLDTQAALTDYLAGLFNTNLETMNHWMTTPTNA